MSTDAMRWAFMQHGMSSPQKFVLVALADRANENHECWPSIDRISLDTELGPRTVQRALCELEKMQLICTKSRAGRSNIFKLVGVVGREDAILAKKKQTTSSGKNQTENHPRQSDTPARKSGASESQGRQSDRGVRVTGVSESQECQRVRGGVSESRPCQSDGVPESQGGVPESQGRGVTLTPRTISEPKGTEREGKAGFRPRSLARKPFLRILGKNGKSTMPSCDAKGKEAEQSDSSRDGKKPYGEGNLKNVWLSDAELSFLEDGRGKELTRAAISQVSLYKASHGKEFDSDLAAILRWGFAAAIERQHPQGPEQHHGITTPPTISKPHSAPQAWEMPDPDDKTPGMPEMVRRALKGDEDARQFLTAKQRKPA